ncbi:hypothetical protein ACKVWC_007060 [Pyricularia oryzae]
MRLTFAFIVAALVHVACTTQVHFGENTDIVKPRSKGPLKFETPEAVYKRAEIAHWFTGSSGDGPSGGEGQREPRPPSSPKTQDRSERHPADESVTARRKASAKAEREKKKAAAKAAAKAAHEKKDRQLRAEERRPPSFKTRDRLAKDAAGDRATAGNTASVTSEPEAISPATRAACEEENKRRRAEAAQLRYRPLILWCGK